MTIALGDIVTTTCQEYNGVIAPRQVDGSNILEEATPEATSEMAAGSLLLASNKCTINDELEFGGLLPCNSSFGTANSPAQLSLKLSPMIHAFQGSAFTTDRRGEGILTTVGGTLTSEGYAWDAVEDNNQGLSLTNTPIGASYAIEMVLKVNNVSGELGSDWVRLITFDTSSDNGWYYLEGALQFYPNTESGVVVFDNTYAHLVLYRDGDANTVGGYVNGVATILDDDSGGDGIPNVLVFFIDDDSVANEISGGVIRRLRVFNRPLTQDEVTARYNCAVSQGLLTA